CASNHAQLFRGIDHTCIDVDGRADNQGISVPHVGKETVSLDLLLREHLPLRLLSQNVERFAGNFFGDNDFHLSKSPWGWICLQLSIVQARGRKKLLCGKMQANCGFGTSSDFLHKGMSRKKPVKIMLFLLTNFSEHRIVSIRSCKTRINTGVNGFSRRSS